MAFYEVVATKPGRKPIYSSANDLADAKALRDQHFSAGDKFVFIRQYIKGGERYRVLWSLTKRQGDRQVEGV